MLDVWVIPAVGIVALAVLIFFLAIRSKGGSGVRTEGRTVMHKTEEEEDMPPS
jgi:hypothetical protein